MVMDSFIQNLKRFHLLSDDNINTLLEISFTKQLHKNDFVLNEGEICNHIYFVKSGLLRIFYFKEHKEISEWFAFENSFCFSIISYFSDVPSQLLIQCIEDSEIIFIPKKELNSLRLKNIEIANFTYRMISGSLILSQHRMFSLQFETALQRYEKLVQINKDFLKRIPLQYIASYLGISPETLSRIRNQAH